MINAKKRKPLGTKICVRIDSKDLAEIKKRGLQVSLLIRGLLMEYLNK